MSGNIPPVIRPSRVEPRLIGDLSTRIDCEFVGSVDDVSVTGLTVMTREIQPGDLFVAVRGARQHGAEFVDEAVSRGAVAVLTDREGAELASSTAVPLVVVESPRAVLGEVANWLFRTDDAPPLFLGVTGTNGKTSTAYLLEAVLRQLGVTTGLSSTAERHIADETVVSRLTTPEASELHALIARMKEKSVGAVAIEVSAQALTHNRVAGIVFDVAGFTNLSHDHLDDYADMDEYFRAKLDFFRPEIAKRGVVSLESEWGARVVAESTIPVTTISSKGNPDAWWQVTVTDESADSVAFTLESRDGLTLTTREPVIGAHMAANAGLAIVMLVEAGFDFGDIASALDRDNGIQAYLPGRTERVSGDRGPNVFVDFGHSPDAFEHTLAAVRKFTRGRTIMVFGADGDRDATKRFDMGRISAEGCDILVITDHHPRFEDPASIRQQLLVGARSVEDGPEIHEASPPESAITLAVSLAKEGDSILWAGPGHQDYRDIRGERTVYSARELARTALKEAGWPL
jgi:UDP-N-acetylmuramoyl-L-alanyl-D-glutamate--2,6-diaminopimelate ligase